MIKTDNYKWNVDTNEVLILPDTAEVGDTVTVCTNVAPINGVVPVSLQISSVPTLGQGYKCLVQTGDNPTEGTLTFEAVSIGTGIITYTVTDGKDKGKVVKTELQIVNKA